MRQKAIAWEALHKKENTLWKHLMSCSKIFSIYPEDLWMSKGGYFTTGGVAAHCTSYQGSKLCLLFVYTRTVFQTRSIRCAVETAQCANAHGLRICSFLPHRRETEITSRSLELPGSWSSGHHL